LLSEAVFLIAICGTSWAATATYPYVILCNFVPPKDRGLAVGILCTINIVSQLIVSVGFGYVIKLTDNTSLTLVMGGICALVVGFMSLLLSMRNPEE
jgi:sugar phosphate permease